jgi:helix-turn-helix protein
MPAPTPLPQATSTQASVTPLAVPPQMAGHMLSLSQSEVYERMRSGELESYQDGRARRVTVASIHAYLARRLAASADGWKQITPPPQQRGRPPSRSD